MNANLLTDWVTIGTSGKTIDGRTISAADLVDMAETYDPAVYTAVVNVEHAYGNLGSVRELRTVPGVCGETALQARIRPNKYFLQQNAEDLRLFSSMEITRNFPPTGKAYLTGLATTDNPASLGTSELHFSARHPAPAERAAAVELDAQKLHHCSEEPAAPGGASEFFKSLTDWVTGKNRKEQDMTNEEVKSLVQSELAPLAEKLESLAAAFEAFAARPQGEWNVTETKPEVETAPAAASETSPAPETGSADFAALLAPLSEQIEALSQQLRAAMQEQPATAFNAATGPAGDDKVKFI